MKYTYLTRDGEIRNMTFKEIGKGISWHNMHNITAAGITKKEAEFLQKYGLQLTIFNVANLRKYGVIQLFEKQVDDAFRNRAIDRRT